VPPDPTGGLEILEGRLWPLDRDALSRRGANSRFRGNRSWLIGDFSGDCPARAADSCSIKGWGLLKKSDACTTSCALSCVLAQLIVGARTFSTAPLL
jgi:hypothetical protein